MRISKWSEIYENAQSRKVLKLSWVPVPNRHDGEKYSEIMARKDAAPIFAAWILMLQVASRSQHRGSLLRDDGRPHTAASLAMKTRAKVEWFELAIPVLLKLGWLDDSPLPACSHPAPTSPVQKGTEGKGTEGTEGNGSESAEFIEFWKSFPISKGKRFQAWEQWQRMACQPVAADIVASVKAHATLPDWHKDGGKWIPAATTFLKERKWENKIKLGAKPISCPIIQGDPFPTDEEAEFK